MTMNKIKERHKYKCDLPTVPVNANTTWQDTDSRSFHRAMFYYVCERYITLDQHGRIKDPVIREMAVKMRKYKESKPKRAQKIAFCPATPPGVTLSSVHDNRYNNIKDVMHPREAGAGVCAFRSSNDEGVAFKYIGASHWLPDRCQDHFTAHKSQMRKGACMEPTAMDFLGTANCQKYKLSATGHLSGNDPTFVVLVQLEPMKKDMLLGDDRPWRIIIQKPSKDGGPTLAHAITAYARGLENQMINRFGSAAIFYDQNTGQWVNTNKLNPKVLGANASKITIPWDKMNQNHRNGAKRMKQLKQRSGDPKFKASAKANQAMAEWAACFAPAVVNRQESTEVEVRVMHYSRSSKNAVAAKAAMWTTPTDTVKQWRQMMLNAKDGKVCEGIKLAKRTTTGLLARLNARLNVTTHEAKQRVVVLHHSEPTMDQICARDVKQALQEVARKQNVYLGGEAVADLKLYWSFQIPIRLKLFNVAETHYAEEFQKQCKCHAFSDQFTRVPTPTKGIQQNARHVATNSTLMLRELIQHGANERAVESLIGKVSMGAQSRLFTKPKQSLAMQMLPGMQKFISGLKKDALIPQSVVLEEFAMMVAQKLQDKAEVMHQKDPHAAGTVDELNQEELRVVDMCHKILRCTEQEKDANGVSSVCKLLMHESTVQELASRQHTPLGLMKSPRCREELAKTLDIVKRFKVMETYHEANEKARQNKRKMAHNDEESEKPATKHEASRIRGNLKLKGARTVAFRWVSNPKETPMFAISRLVSAVQAAVQPEMLLHFTAMFTSPPNDYGKEEAKYLKSLSRKPWRVNSTAEAIAVMRKMFVAINESLQEADNTQPEEHPPKLQSKDFGAMFVRLVHDHLKASALHALDKMTGITHFLVRVMYGPIRYDVQKIDKEGAASLHRKGIPRGCHLISKAEYYEMYCRVIEGNVIAYAGRAFLQAIGVAMGLPSSPATSAQCLAWFEWLFVEEAIRKKAWSMILHSEHAAMLVDDAFCWGDVLQKMPYLEDKHTYKESTCPERSAKHAKQISTHDCHHTATTREITMGGVYPRGGTNGAPLQMQFNLEHCLQNPPPYHTKAANSIPFLDTRADYINKSSSKHHAPKSTSRMIISAHAKRSMPKSKGTTYLRFTSYLSNVRKTAKSGLMDGEMYRLAHIPDLWREFVAVASRSMLDLYLQGMPYAHLLAATHGRLKNQNKYLRVKWGRTEKATTTATVLECRKGWRLGTRTLDIRNACLNLPGPARRPKCQPGDAMPMQNVNSSSGTIKMTRKGWQIAEPYKLSEKSWKNGSLVFDVTGRCNVRLQNGDELAPEGGFYYDAGRKLLHAPITGQVYFLRLEGEASGHACHQSHE